MPWSIVRNFKQIILKNIQPWQAEADFGSKLTWSQLDRVFSRCEKIVEDSWSQRHDDVNKGPKREDRRENLNLWHLVSWLTPVQVPILNSRV